MMTSFLATLIPLFVSLNVLGILPIYIGMTRGMSEDYKRRLVFMSMVTAFVFGVFFVFTGQLVFNFLGITPNDFRVAGGLVLLTLSIYDLIFSNQRRRSPKAETEVNVVPLAVPMLIGPATLTTILILVDSYGYVMTLLSFALNILVITFLFLYSTYILKVLGDGGSRAVAKISALFMGAIAVMMIRVGLTNMILGH